MSFSETAATTTPPTTTTPTATTTATTATTTATTTAAGQEACPQLLPGDVVLVPQHLLGQTEVQQQQQQQQLQQQQKQQQQQQQHHLLGQTEVQSPSSQTQKTKEPDSENRSRGTDSIAFLQHLSADASCCILLLPDGRRLRGVPASALRPAKALRMEVPDVSIQVVTFCRPQLLRHALWLASRQDIAREQLEVLVVDDSPSCSLAAGCLEGLDADFVRQCLRFVALEQRVSIGAKRNLAAALSRGTVIMHWDDDDYFGANRARAQSMPILAGKADVTLLPLVHSFYTGDQHGPDGFFEAALSGAGSCSGHLSTLCYRRSLWDSGDELRRYADASLMEDLFLYRNLQGLFGALCQDLPAGSVDFVYVKHPASASAQPRVGRPSPGGQPPGFLPEATLRLMATLRDASPPPVGAVRLEKSRSVLGQLQQEQCFLAAYLRRGGGLRGRSRVPRRLFMDLARMLPLMPSAHEKEQALQSLAAQLLDVGQATEEQERDEEGATAVGLARLDGPSMAMAAWCCSTLRLPPGHAFWAQLSVRIRFEAARAPESAAEPRLDEGGCCSSREEFGLTAADVSMLTYVAGRVGLGSDQALLLALLGLAQAPQRLAELGPKDVVNLASAFARLFPQSSPAAPVGEGATPVEAAGAAAEEAVPLLGSLLRRFPPEDYASEDWLRLTWAVFRLRPLWAEEHLFPRFTRAPLDVATALYARLDALARRRSGRAASDVQVQVLNGGPGGAADVPVLLLRGFASPAECRELARLAEEQCWQRTENSVRKVDVSIFNQQGTATHPLVLDIRRRAALLAGQPIGHCESLNLVRYEEGEQHKPHYDYVQEAPNPSQVDVRFAVGRPEPSLDSMFLGGQRFCTVLLYLSSTAEDQGGETAFGELGLKVRPEIGAALIWPNVQKDGQPEPRTVHGSLPLRYGEKLVVNAWLRSEDVDYFRSNLLSAPIRHMLRRYPEPKIKPWNTAPPTKETQEPGPVAWEAADWEARLREVLVKAVSGPCVLDLQQENILSFGQGDWAYVEKDLRAAFSPALADALLACFSDEVQACLACRRELINFKKLCLHLWQAGSGVEKDLRQLASFFYCEVVSSASEAAEQAAWQLKDLRRRRYVEISSALNECRGSVAGIWDARNFAKAICALPRHPDRGVPWKFEALPGSLEVWKPLQQARHFLTNHRALDAHWAARWPGRAGEEEETAEASNSEAVEVAGLQLPGPVLIARGCSKAVAIRSALQRYCAALRQAVAEAEDLAKQLEALLGGKAECGRVSDAELDGRTSFSGTAVSAGLHLHCTRHLLVLKGMRPVLAEMLRWLAPMVELRGDSARSFVSGSRGAAAFVPRGFPDILGKPVQEEELKVKLTRLWLHRGLCLTCEELRDDARTAGIVCEQWSCEKCALLRGDGEDVWQLASQRQPAVIFLDFDRTLCTTKAGASPLEGNHSLDTDLVSVCSSHGRVRIVTRNSRREDIAEFLGRHGVEARVFGDSGAASVPSERAVWVRSVKREGLKSKAEVILQAQRFEDAASCYSEALEQIRQVLPELMSDNSEVQALAVPVRLNLAACLQRLGDRSQEVIDLCDEVLQLDPSSVKALFRRATAQQTRAAQLPDDASQRSALQYARQDLVLAAKAEPADRQIRAVLEEVNKSLAGLQKSAGWFSSCSGLYDDRQPEAPPPPPTVCATCGSIGHPACGRSCWITQRAQWLGVSEEEAGNDPADFEEDGSLMDAVRRLRPDCEVTDSLSDLSEDERDVLEDCLESTQKPYPELKRALPLSQAVRCAEELWAETTD
ncbi:unnamed protein product [Polarella glacialis]|uniref:procollagen-lysine 5-dioxygenase n=1 Tax=Polarella glacialis TaxID=89957 RepID=A0A813EGN8_POLGL|nr:unnamed protein product [Polarella glacialis]